MSAMLAAQTSNDAHVVSLLAIAENFSLFAPLATALDTALARCHSAVALKKAARQFAERLVEVDQLISSQHEAINTYIDTRDKKLKVDLNKLTDAVNESAKWMEPLCQPTFIVQLFTFAKTERGFEGYDKGIVSCVNVLTAALGIADSQMIPKIYNTFDPEKFINENGGFEEVATNEEKLNAIATALEFPKELVRNEIVSHVKHMKDFVDDVLSQNREVVKKVQEELNNTSIKLPEVEISFLQFNQSDMLGKGGFGSVYSGTYFGQDVAVKTLNNVGRQLTPQQAKDLCKEVKNMYILGKHEGFVSLFGVNFGCKDIDPCIVMELAEGTLEDLIHTNKLNIDLTFARKMSIALDIVRAMDIVFRLDMIYRDLKPPNVLIFSKGVDVTAKLTDFGLAKGVSEVTGTNTTPKGTVRYMAPELFKDISASGVQYSFASDVYTLGITLNEMMTEKLPFPDFKGDVKFLMKLIEERNQPILYQTSHTDLPTHRAIESIIKACLSLEPTNRPSMSVLVDDLQLVCSAVLDIAKQGPASEAYSAPIRLRCVPYIRSLASLNHEECIFLLEHLTISDARAMLGADVTGEQLAAVNGAADIKKMGIELKQMKDNLMLKNKLKKFVESGIEQSILDERRALFVEERAKLRGVPPLLLACEEKDDAVVNILVDKGEDVKVVLKDGRSLLHVAASLGDSKVVLSLLARGADARAQSSDGPLALTVAHLAGYQEIVSLILEKAYGKVSLKDLSNQECSELLFVLGCTVDKSEGVSAEVLLAIVTEENEEDREKALKELGN